MIYYIKFDFYAVWEGVRPSVRLSVCPFVRPSVRLSIRLSVCPFIRLSVGPSVGPYNNNNEITLEGCGTFWKQIYC